MSGLKYEEKEVDEKVEKQIEDTMKQGHPPHWGDPNREQIVAIKVAQMETEGTKTYPKYYTWGGEGSISNIF